MNTDRKNKNFIEDKRCQVFTLDYIAEEMFDIVNMWIILWAKEYQKNCLVMALFYVRLLSYNLYINKCLRMETIYE